MTKAIDPFEEYLRKKKVELLERKYRDGDASQTPLPRPSGPPTDEDPDVEARLREEMDDFFQSGQSAGVQAFQQAQDIGEDKVEEIKDALDDVFENDVPAPQTVDENDDAGDTFVSFFKQVQEEYDETPVCDDVSCLPMEDGSPPPPPPAKEEVAPAELRGAAVEIAFDDTEHEEALPEPGDRRLDLEEILVEGARKQDLEKRVDVLCRLLAKVVKRSGLPESEIIEALIKGGLDF